jgi:hypothetical protein
MNKPSLDKLWRTWIKIGFPQQTVEANFSSVVKVIRSQVTEVVSILETKQMIDWYYFLIHRKDNDPTVGYFDVIFSVKEDVTSEEFVKALPSYCLEPKHLEHFGESISGIPKEQLKNEEIEEAWRIIGEQSEWIIYIVNVYKDGELTIPQFIQFMHFYMNMMGLGCLSGLAIPNAFFPF